MNQSLGSVHLSARVASCVAWRSTATTVRHLVLIVLLVGGSANSALAHWTWTGHDSEYWSNPDNWKPSGVPLSSDNLTFDETALSFHVDLDGQDREANSITIDSGDSGTPYLFTDSGGGNTLTPGNVLVRGTGHQFDLSVSLGSGADYSISNGADLLISGDISGTGALLSKAGGGTLTLTGANSYSGGTTISAGTLQIGDGGTAGSVTGDIANNGSLVFNRSDNFSFNGDISGTGSLTKTGAGILTLTGNSALSGDTNAEGGVLIIDSGGVLSNNNGFIDNMDFGVGGVGVRGAGSEWNISGNLELEGGGLDSVAVLSIEQSGLVSVGGNTTVGEYGVVGLHGGSLTTGSFYSYYHSGVVFDDGALTINGGEFVTAETSITIEGYWDYGLATLRLTNGAGSLPLSDTVVVGGDHSSGALEISGGTEVNTQTALIAQRFSGTVTVTGTGSTWTVGDLEMGVSGNATLQIAASGQVIVSGTTTFGPRGAIELTGGTLQTATLDSQAGTGRVTFDGGTLQLTSATSIDHDIIVSAGGGTIDALGVLSYNGNLSLGGNTLAIASGLFLQSNQTLAATGTIHGRTSGDANSTITATGDLTLGDSSSLAGFSTGGFLNVGANTVTLHSAGFANLGILTTINGGTLSAPNGIHLGGGANLQAGGTVDAAVAAGFGSTIVATGNLTVGDATAVDGFFSDGRLFTNDNTVTLLDANQAVLGSLTQLGDTTGGTLTATNGFVLDFGKNLLGEGTVNNDNIEAHAFLNNGYVEGTLSGIEFTGYCKGIGDFAGTIIFSGTFSPGLSPGDVALEDMVLTDTCVLEIELGGYGQGTEYDHLDVSGLANLDGTLDVRLIDGFAPLVGNTFDVLDWSTLAGTFDEVLLPGLESYLAWDTDDLYVTGEIGVTYLTGPGDANLDGIVNLVDLGVVGDNWNGTGKGWEEGDFDGNGIVNLIDLGIVGDNWNTVYSEGTAPNAVPEPSTLILLSMGVVGLLTCIRRRRLQAGGRA